MTATAPELSLFDVPDAPGPTAPILDDSTAPTVLHTEAEARRTAEATIARVRQMADAWEQRLPAKILTATAVEALRTATERYALAQPRQRSINPVERCPARRTGRNTVITFTGGGDDNVCVTAPGQSEEYLTYQEGPVMWRADVTGPETGQAIRVTALFDEGQTGCWSFAAGQVDDDTPMPDWPISIRQAPDTSYSALLAIDAPAGTTIRNICPTPRAD